MKLFAHLQSGGRRGRAAFTLVEMMIAAGIYLVIFVSAMVAIQIFALRIYTLGATKLTATEGSRKALNQIRDDIRQGKGLLVGNSDNVGDFTAFGGTNGAVGNALEIFSTTNFSGPPYSIYYLQTNTVGNISSNNLLWISVTSLASNTVKLASYITNLDVFSAQDCWGNTISNSVANNQVYTVKLQFYQWEYPIAIVTTNAKNGLNAYDYYQLRTRVCRRALD